MLLDYVHSYIEIYVQTYINIYIRQIKAFYNLVIGGVVLPFHLEFWCKVRLWVLKPPKRRYFMIGIALVCGIVSRIGESLSIIFDKEE